MMREQERRAAILALHERYLIEQVEDMDLCPFARRSRVQGRVHRPCWWLGAREQLAPREVIDALVALVEAHPEVEIVLPTFICDVDHPWQQAERFETFLRSVREGYEGRGGEPFYMVSFHPAPRLARGELSADSLVVRLRRTPDPVIQCVRVSALERVRRAANARAHLALLDELERRYGALDPSTREVIANSAPQNHLSQEIARRNFEAVGHGEGLAALEAALDGLWRERRALDASGGGGYSER